MTATHDLKCWPEVFEATRFGIKRCEFRRDDRTPPFAAGQVLRLCEWDPVTERYTGDHILVGVLHVLRGPAFGIPEGFALMSVALMRMEHHHG